VALGNGSVLAGTDVGVFLSSGDGSWLAVGSNLPSVPVLDVRFDRARGVITAATFGHGMQRFTLP
jgi:hypothetical protein